MTPIRDYAIIGDCQTAALVNPNGGIDWLCLPTFDSPSLFARLLDDEQGGDFTIQPNESFEVTREYLEDSAILQTRFRTASGTMRLTDFFVVARKADAHFFDFTSLHPTRRLVRLVEWESGGAVSLKLRVHARPNYAKERALWTQSSPTAFGLKEATLFTSAPLAEVEGDLAGDLTVAPNESFFAVLDYTEERRPPDLDDIRRWLKITTAFWREWNSFNPYQGPYRELVRRSAVTLKLLTYAATGAFVAAPTTSLPEKIGGEANWDYRFTWVRDTALFIQTFFALGYSGEAEDFLQFACQRWQEKREMQGPDFSKATLDVLYPVCHNPLPPETTLDHLAGYRNSRPVRLGNRAAEQFQLDNYGHFLQSLHFYQQTGGEISENKREMINAFTAEVMRFWEYPDNGLWEAPERELFTYGKVMCWLAMQRARDLVGDANGDLAKTAAAIRNQIMTRGLTSASGPQILSAKLDEESLDASSLLAFTTGFLPSAIAGTTRAAIEKKLGRDPFLYRNESERTEEGAFLLCSFWWVNHLICEGEFGRAEELLARIIGKASPLGLLSEEIDPDTGEFLGNFPQAFSHLGLIQSILNLEEAKKRKGRFHALPDHEKFRRTVGSTVGWKGLVATILRTPRTLSLIFSSESKWSE